MFIISDGPFKALPLRVHYSVFAFLVYNSISVYFTWSTNYFLFFPISYIVSEINFSFIFFAFLMKKRYAQALNQIVKLTRRIRHLDFKRSELFYPHIPVLIIAIKVIYDYETLSSLPVFAVVNAVGVLIKDSLDGLLITWLLCVEKIINRINRQIRNSCRVLTVRQLQPLMMYFFDVQDFVFFISEYVGLPHLILIIITLIANTLYIHKFLPNLVLSFRQLNIATIKELIYLTEWQFRVYTFLIICCRSQRINEAVCVKYSTYIYIYVK